MSAIGDGIALLDQQGRVLQCNKALIHILDRPAGEVFGRPYDSLLLEIGLPEAATLRRVLESHNYQSIEWSVGSRWLHLAADPVLDAAGRFAGAVCVISDITERKRAEEERERLLASERRANEEKDIFLATISHELRTPLSAVLGWARLLRTGRLDEAAYARALDSLERNAQAQAQLINDLLDVSRATSGKLNLELRPVKLAPLVEAALDAVRPAAGPKEIRLETAVGSGDVAVSGDPNRLQQVLLNLLSNAVKFTPKGGRIQARLDQTGPDALIAVSDTGQGISPEFLPHVFDRFQQASTSGAVGHGGLGLGLAIARHLVELHGGTIQAESAGEGQGATFIVKLPAITTTERRSADSGSAG